MKINHGTIRIEEVDGISQLISEDSVITLRLERPDLTFSMVAGIRDALTAMLQEVGHERDANLTGPWARWEDIPDSVTKVYDCDGDFITCDLGVPWATRLAGDSDHRNNRYAPYRLGE